ncbi:hypothetical protein BDR04DRAFT_1111953 [Suillus decipiens]|nr:hypothetical protein BDR04DRAFT_1111953 [Suillus decipiens]
MRQNHISVRTLSKKNKLLRTHLHNTYNQSKTECTRSHRLWKFRFFRLERCIACFASPSHSMQRIQAVLSTTFNGCQGLTLEKTMLDLRMDSESSHTDNYIRECDVGKTFARYSQESKRKIQQQMQCNSQ